VSNLMQGMTRVGRERLSSVWGSGEDDYKITNDRHFPCTLREPRASSSVLPPFFSTISSPSYDFLLLSHE